MANAKYGSDESYFEPIIRSDSDVSSKDSSGEPMDRGELQRLALASQESTATLVTTPGTIEKQSSLHRVATGHQALDPSSPQFDCRTWVRWFLDRQRQAGTKQKPHGVTFKNLTISGYGPDVRYMETVLSTLLIPFRWQKLAKKPNPKTIISKMNGSLNNGEMLLVLGRPGSGCSTLLKALSNELTGLDVAEDSTIHYSGVPQQEMRKHFRGETTYNEETDKHFPHLTVWQTLQFAARCKTPAVRFNDVSKSAYADELAGVVAAAYGLWEVRNTIVGNDWIRGVSGGQRKRVSLAEMAMAGNTMACWDNSTRGLDSATALEFVKSLRLSCEFTGACHAVAIYQASQAIYDLFDKVTLLYEGREVYYGGASKAKRYFEEMGWFCPPRQTTADFLTSITNPKERQIASGHGDQVPQTAKEFERYWLQSDGYKACIADIARHEEDNPSDGAGLTALKDSHRAVQSKHARPGSPYIVSIAAQVNACLVRASQLTRNQISTVVSTIISQVIISLIIGSIYFGTPDTTSGLYSKASALFIAILFNALQAVGEVGGLFAQRPIIAKQAGYGFCHPFADSLASIFLNFPIKLVGAVFFNIVLYFLAGLRMEPARFFIYFLFVVVAQQTMSMIFRTLASVTRTLPQALTLSGIFVLIISIYTGFSIPRPYMHPWFEWLSYINPVFYAFEALLVNEVHGVLFPCGTDVVPYPYQPDSKAFICSTIGAVAGQTGVSGDRWVRESYGYSYTHLWRNFGIVLAFFIGFMFTYLVATEMNASHGPNVVGSLIFKRQKSKQDSGTQELPQTNTDEKPMGKESVTGIPHSAERTFNWSNITYDIPIKGSSEPRRLLDNVSGWVRPGTLTALMGSSGAGKTTLLDVLAQRTSTGVVGGDRRINGVELGSLFQRETGYVQQQDLHLATSTVREALRFSAALRQPSSTPTEEKYAYVEHVINKLGMEAYGEALVGDSDIGEGLNVEQRKMLSIGVELVAKPSLLIFLDEPTSGLDSQSAYTIISLLRSLANDGQAILATIHQPSAVLFEEFDRLLFMAGGGKTIYFGDLGRGSRTLLDYFERSGARSCDNHGNPAEYMLEVVGNKDTGQDWHQIWKSSPEKEAIDRTILELRGGNLKSSDVEQPVEDEFAIPLMQQLRLLTVRIFQQYWRSPSYIISKLALAILSSLFIGFTFFQSDSSQRGLQNILLSIFSSQSILSVLVQQIMPRFVVQRTIYEARERPSRMYSWLAFVISNIVVEIPFQIFLGILAFASYYYAVIGIQSSERQGLILLFFIQNFVFASTFAQMIIAGLPDAEAAGSLATIFLFMCNMFNGVMQSPDALPGFWIFMYRVSPLTYLVGGITSTGLHGRELTCRPEEVSKFNPPPGQTCGQYLASYLRKSAGRLLNPDASSSCQYCPLRTADQFLAGNKVYWSDRWRNFGILFAFIIFNILATIGLYWLARVRPLREKGTRKFSKKMKAWSLQFVLWARILFVRDAGEDKTGREAKVDKLY